ncbi:MAG: hypothetical protein LC725_04805, partial [Lentisphaerae bacterium]|nr:hypothetical protein [Lentisphaerota bacterium]
MSLKILIAVTLLWAGRGLTEQSVVKMNFYEAYEARQAETQLSYKKHEAAYEAYSSLAARTSDPDLATLAKARAAVAFGLQQDNYEQGLEQARAVTDRPVSVQAQMQLMVACADYQKLLDAFAEEDIAAWPKRTLPNMERWGRQDLRALALVDRARAYLETGNAQVAVA